MRVFAIATILLLSSSAVPLFAQNQENSPAVSQPQATPVQPERTPEQSEQSRDRDRQRAEDTQVGRDWRTQQRGGDNMGRMGQNDMEHMREKMDRDRDWDHRTMGRNWQMHHDDDRAGSDRYGRGYYDEDLPRHRVKICVEYENGDEYCHYR